jgi:Tfp pilus assembly protein PilE
MKRNLGFTVIELVVAVTIVFLLVAVAVASFQDHMMRKDRAQARKDADRGRGMASVAISQERDLSGATADQAIA